MKQYTVTGMSCAACQAHVEKAVSAVPGVEKVAVSLLTNSMSVEGSAEDAAIISAVEKALQGFGYTVLQSHMESCVAEEVRNGNPDIMAETLELMKKLK